jgi:hypothetical protein
LISGLKPWAFIMPTVAKYTEKKIIKDFDIMNFINIVTDLNRRRKA